MKPWTGAANVFAEQPTSPTRRRDLTVRPTSILDPRFRYMPSNCTDVTVTWRRFGFNPQRNAERRGEIGGHSDPQACNFLCEDSNNGVAKRKIFTSAAIRDYCACSLYRSLESA